MNLPDEAIEAAARAHDVERKQWFLRRNNMNPPGVQWEICRYGDPGKDEIFVKGTAPTYDRGVVAFIEMRNAAAIRAAAPFLVPEGWVMVPKEPDEAMIYAAHKMAVREDILSITFKTRKLWEAMIDAALPQPTGVSECQTLTSTPSRPPSRR